MSWGATAIAGATLVTGYMASESAKNASDKASRSSKAQLAFERRQYEDWQETYGPIEQNLAEFYTGLTPDYYEAQGLQAFEREQERTLTSLKTTLAQRGIEDSGVALAIEKDMGFAGAEGRARIRAEAPYQVAEEQRNFLQVGLGLDPSSSYSQALAQKAETDRIASQQAAVAAQQGTASAVSATGTALASYLNRPTQPVAQPDVGTTSANYPVDYSAYA